MLRTGIVGLPNVGKSTLFNAVTRTRKAEAANYPFCTIDPNVGTVTVPDARLAVLQRIAGTNVVIPAAIEFVDIAGLVKGASEGEGLGNKFLTHVREVDAMVQVVRCFEDEDIHHVSGTVDPVRDIEVINTELMLSDLDSVQRRRERLVKDMKRGEGTAAAEDKVLARIEEDADYLDRLERWVRDVRRTIDSVEGILERCDEVVFRKGWENPDIQAEHRGNVARLARRLGASG